MTVVKQALPSKLYDHYSNILLLAPDGQALATIPSKRARWYRKRELVEQIEDREGFTEVLRLKVEPTGRPTKDVLPLENQCVVCGSHEKLSCHHVVPRAIRVYFDPVEKEHASNWCVLVCEEHHLAAEKLARVLYEKPLQDAVGIVHLAKAKETFALARQAHLDGVKIDLTPYVTARKLAVKEAHKQCAENLIESFGGLQKTKELFRDKFLELNPQYLPHGFLTDDWQR